jgi:hypothetical protein
MSEEGFIVNKSELILTAIALALGIASVVLGILKTVSPETIIILLGVGLMAISTANFQKRKK